MSEIQAGDNNTENSGNSNKKTRKIKSNGSGIKTNSTMKEFYSNLTTPVFLCTANEILWHNSAADVLFKNCRFRQYILQFDKSKKETSKVFICDDQYYKILIRPFNGTFFLEVIDQWSLSSTVDFALSSFEAPAVLDTVARNASHQIFQAINALSKVLEETSDTSNLKHLDHIANAVHCVLRATNLYNEYSQLERGTIDSEIVDIFGEIDALCSTVNSLMQKTDIAFSWVVPDEKVFCDIDMHKFSFSLFHLICNAYMFTAPKNEVKVVAKKLGNNSISVEIIDKGAGISPEIINKITTPYFSYSSATGDIAGCGLGLTYASVFVAKAGGALTISSENGETVVSIMMPIVELTDSDGLASHVVDYKIGKYHYMISTMSTVMLDF